MSITETPMTLIPSSLPVPERDPVLYGRRWTRLVSKDGVFAVEFTPSVAALTPAVEVTEPPAVGHALMAEHGDWAYLSEPWAWPDFAATTGQPDDVFNAETDAYTAMWRAEHGAHWQREHDVLKDRLPFSLPSVSPLRASCGCPRSESRHLNTCRSGYTGQLNWWPEPDPEEDAPAGRAVCDDEPVQDVAETAGE